MVSIEQTHKVLPSPHLLHNFVTYIHRHQRLTIGKVLHTPVVGPVSTISEGSPAWLGTAPPCRAPVLERLDTFLTGSLERVMERMTSARPVSMHANLKNAINFTPSRTACINLLVKALAASSGTRDRASHTIVHCALDGWFESAWCVLESCSC